MAEGERFSYSNVEIPTRLGDSLHGHCWAPNGDAKSVCVAFHGYGAHGRYATVLFAAEMLAAEGHLVLSADFHGHGKSPGAPGYISDEASLLNDGLDLAMYAQETYPSLPCFLLGNSMGGAIALRVSLASPTLPYKGAVLMSPMVSVKEDSKPPSWQMPLLRGLAMCPGIRSVGMLNPKGLDPEKQYKDPERRAMCVDDALSYSGSMCLASANALLNTTLRLNEQIGEVSIPLLVIHGDADEICPLEGSQMLIDTCTAEDKTLSVYPGMLHAPLAEPQETRAKVEAEVCQWLSARL